MHTLVSQMLDGDKRALSRLMTYVDNRHEDLISIMRDVYELAQGAWRIGVTGPPGSGKSTLVDKLIGIYRSEGLKVGVIAIDPSSPFTGGAVLGDRIRMMDHGGDDGVFIRSLGSRGSHGGLSRATRDVVLLMDAFGFDVILVETVGVGQTELDIMAVADTTVVVLVPESGDTIQTMKAGLMEIADVFVVNKADRIGADRIYAELASLSQLFSDVQIPVFKTEAIHKKGIEELARELKKIRTKKSDKHSENLLVEETLDVFLSELATHVTQELSAKGKFKKQYTALTAKHKNPYRCANDLMKFFSGGLHGKTNH